MARKNPQKVPAELIAALDINVETGEARWALDVSSRARKGNIAGTTTPDGYRKVCWKGVYHYLHRIIWAKVHGPDNIPRSLDHRNRRPGECGIGNLRPASQAQNNVNVPARRTYRGEPCVSSLKGVTRYDNGKGWVRWKARIRVDGKEKSLGYFNTEEEAAEAYRKAALTHYGEYAATAA